MNELIAYSMKYAFPGLEEGAVASVPERYEDKGIHLSVKDNGEGLHPLSKLGKAGAAVRSFFTLSQAD